MRFHFLNLLLHLFLSIFFFFLILEPLSCGLFKLNPSNALKRSLLGGAAKTSPEAV